MAYGRGMDAADRRANLEALKQIRDHVEGFLNAVKEADSHEELSASYGLEELLGQALSGVFTCADVLTQILEDEAAGDV